MAVGAIAFVLVGGWSLSSRLGYLATVTAALAAGFALFAGTLLLIGSNTVAADMLPVIEHAIDVFRAGGDPYAADYTSVTLNPFFYTPGQWLVFLPPRLAGLDIRIVNIVAALLMVLVTERAARRGDPGLRTAVYPIMLSPRWSCR
jgi:hypothetical protein